MAQGGALIHHTGSRNADSGNRSAPLSESIGETEGRNGHLHGTISAGCKIRFDIAHQQVFHEIGTPHKLYIAVFVLIAIACDVIRIVVHRFHTIAFFVAVFCGLRQVCANADRQGRMVNNTLPCNLPPIFQRDGCNGLAGHRADGLSLV
ncbi:hypothetical protein DSECCO2_365370 [anaerobic digester metagenome]